MRNKIRLDTASDAIKLAGLVKDIDGTIVITDKTGFRVNAKSVLGALYALEFSELWIESENDIYNLINEFII